MSPESVLAAAGLLFITQSHGTLTHTALDRGEEVQIVLVRLFADNESVMQRDHSLSLL